MRERDEAGDQRLGLHLGVGQLEADGEAAVAEGVGEGGIGDVFEAARGAFQGGVVRLQLGGGFIEGGKQRKAWVSSCSLA